MAKKSTQRNESATLNDAIGTLASSTEPSKPAATSDDGITGSDNETVNAIDPASAESTSDLGTLSNGKPRQRRQRSDAGKPKSGTKETQADLTVLLVSTHALLAKLVKCEELEITEDEAKKLDAGIRAVQKEFGLAIINPKAAAITQLVMACGEVYGPRLIAVTFKDKQRRKNPEGVIVIDAETIPQQKGPGGLN